MYDKVIGIDVGISGGLVVWTNKFIGSVKMPSYPTMTKAGKKRNNTDVKAIELILERQKQNCNPIIFIEKVQGWTGKDDTARQYSIQKMLANYESLKTVIVLSGIPMVEVTPQQWQTFLNLKVKGEEPKERKKRYKRFAAKTYLDLKVTAWNGDAACLCEFGRRKLYFDINWVNERLNKKF
jgi:hypothetical protein